MAAPRARCANCGEPFDRRAVNQSYCFKLACRRARNRERLRAWRQTKAQLHEARWQATIRRAAT
jgi:hypothetical protein